jgi:hypothetical protein
MPTYSGGKDESPNRDEPFTGDGNNENTDRKPDKREITVRTKGGSALLKSTNDLFKEGGKHR